MAAPLKMFLENGKKFLQRYPVVIAALVIYLYYLMVSVDFFNKSADSGNKGIKSLLDYVIEFDSLFFLWAAAAALIQLQRFRKESSQKNEKQRQLELVLERQRISNALINEITLLMQDTINNPLGVISMTTQEIRRRFMHDMEILKWVDRIESSTQRITKAIRDIQIHETQKALEISDIKT